MLTSIKIHNFRNLSYVDLTLNTKFNLLYGMNGSGKTSFLEAIHFLGLGRSFRTHLSARLIRKEQEQFLIHGIVSQKNLAIPMGVQRKRNEAKIRINGKDIESYLELAKILPLQFINGEPQQFFSEGAKPRRQFLDWGVFHVEPTFWLLWQRAMQALKQRNAALRERIDIKQIKLWENELAVAAEALHHLRSKYVQVFEIEFARIRDILLPNNSVQLQYQRGWPAEINLSQALACSRQRDVELGFSQYGPQRADLKLLIGNTSAADMLSQGQQKLLIYALRLTQGILLRQLAGNQCIYLIDDLPSELDYEKQQLITQVLMQLEAQVFITGIHQKELSSLFMNSYEMFHVEQGKIMR